MYDDLTIERGFFVMGRMWTSLPDKLQTEFEQIADEEGRSLSGLVAFILESWLVGYRAAKREERALKREEAALSRR